MKINTLDWDHEFTNQKGIKPIYISKNLSKVVALIGKNGSGKTRILKLLETYLTQPMPINVLSNRISLNSKNGTNIIDNISPNVSNIDKQKAIQYFELVNSKKDKNDIAKINQLKTLENEIRKKPRFQSFLNKILLETSKIKNYFRIISHEDILKLKNTFDSKSTTIIPFEKLIDEVSNDIDVDEFKSISISALSFLSKMPHQLVADKLECEGDEKKFRNRTAYRRYSAFRQILMEFLGKNIEFERVNSNVNVTEVGGNLSFTGKWKLDGLDFKYEDLSDGEKIQFAFAILFFLLQIGSKIRIKDCIIIMDEPELHLHSKAQVEIFTKLKNLVNEGTGQLWIASHSLSILSNLEFDEIFLVKDSEIFPPCKDNPANSLEEIAGIKTITNKMSEFLTSITDSAYTNFIVQCFNDPGVVEFAKKDDPQVMAFLKTINKNGLKVLDFGAGVGRLYKSLKKENSFAQKIQTYDCLEINPESLHVLNELNIPGKVYNDSKSLPTAKYDSVLLCNVLHEIKLSEWQITLNKLIKSLKPEGSLIIIEVRKIPIGEMIEEAGFLVLDTKELKELFVLEDEPLDIYKENEKIMCTVIRKESIKIVSKPAIKRALAALYDNTLDEIIKLRRDGKDAKNNYDYGMKIGFYSQLNINSKIGIDLLGNNFKIKQL